MNDVSIRVVCPQCGGHASRGWCGTCQGRLEVMQTVPEDILKGDRVDLACYLVGRRLEVMSMREERA